MLLLTGATGTIGLPLLSRLTAAGVPVRCLVRDPRRLGAQRVKVQIALGDLADHDSFRHALRGVDTVVHLASVIRDQPLGTIEELAGAATWRLVRAAERADVERFVFFSVPGASPSSPSRLLRAKAIAERAVVESPLPHTIFSPSWVYGRGDPFMTVVAGLSLLPIVPIPGSGRARFQPMSAEDVADCVIAALPGGSHGDEAAGARYELGGPETMDVREIVRVALESIDRRRRVIGLPLAVARPVLDMAERLFGEAAVATWDEVQLVTLTTLVVGGTADAERLGVTPRTMREAFGLEA